jgi:hypothetical protein
MATRSFIDTAADKGRLGRQVARAGRVREDATLSGDPARNARGAMWLQFAQDGVDKTAHVRAGFLRAA